ncbi:MAG TPA: GGDEF domain-containing protein [Vicinamibacterales bacterium]|nr:GGDEF domain-containing protein [Vicinamibacterales bacterium]
MNLASGAAAIITCLLLLLHLYRRSPYILYWTAGWACLALSLGLDSSGRGAGTFNALRAAGSQFLMVAVGLCFLTAANAYRRDSRVPRVGAPLVVAVAAWFVLAAVAWGSPVVFVSGYALTAISLAIAALAHATILLRVRMLGVAVVGAALTVAAAVNVWMLLSSAARGGPALSDAFFVELALYLVVALGMQLMTFEDMTEELTSANFQLKAAQIELRQMVVTDSLTGLHNRRFFEEIIAHELNLHRRYGTPLSLVFLDVDRFKSINDTLGHAAGDNTLRDVASFLTRHVRNADYVFRWGGDEFLILLSCREEEANRKGWELQSEFSRSSTVAALPEGVGLSFGCAEVSALAESATEALHLADERMYADKRAARLPLLETLENVRTGEG